MQTPPDGKSIRDMTHWQGDGCEGGHGADRDPSTIPPYASGEGPRTSGEGASVAATSSPLIIGDGVCPDGHPCVRLHDLLTGRPSEYRICLSGEYVGRALGTLS